jgi:hypothetical protein
LTEGYTMIDLRQLRFIGEGLSRPECVLATRSGDLFVSDTRGGVSMIRPDGAVEFTRALAEQADIVDINLQLQGGRIVPNRTILAGEELDAMFEHVRACAGERMDRIELSHRAFHVDVSGKRAEAIARASQRFEAPEWRIVETPYALIGSTDSIVEDLLRNRERWGLSYVIVGPEAIDNFAPVVAALGTQARPMSPSA